LTPTFSELGVPAGLATVLAERGITVPTPIQAAALPDALAGRDVLGRGRTGSGKTYAFLVPLVARLAASPGRRTPRRPRALILAPTRELVTQIDTALAPLAAATGLTSLTVFGGVGQNPQVAGLRRGVDVVVACPGRLEDLMAQGHLDLGGVDVTVLDEADHMADLGFLPAVRRILERTPQGGQRLLFSATLDAGVDVLVNRYMARPVTHQADSAQSPVSTMAHHVLNVSHDARLPVLLDLTAAPGRRIVFTRTKHGAKKLTKQLNAAGVAAVELHGNLGQNARTRNMDRFHDGTATTLVATDIAARGIHVDDIEIVIHADPPVEHKAYLHRSGRTARAGADGLVVTLATDDQLSEVRDLTRRAGVKPTTTRVHATHPLLRELAPGERVFTDGLAMAAASASSSSSSSSSSDGSSGRGGSGRGTSSRGTSARGTSARGTSARGTSSRGGSPRAGSDRSSTPGEGRPSGQRAGAGASRGRRTARTGGSAQVYSTSSGSPSSSSRPSGGAAAFSASTRAGRSR
jgi:superfamily II DNA/RNA helicase